MESWRNCRIFRKVVFAIGQDFVSSEPMINSIRYFTTGQDFLPRKLTTNDVTIVRTRFMGERTDFSRIVNIERR